MELHGHVRVSTSRTATGREIRSLRSGQLSGFAASDGCAGGGHLRAYSCGLHRPTSTVAVMNEFMIGYARVSTNEQDLTAQQNALEALGVRSNLIYTDHGLTGTNRARPGLTRSLSRLPERRHPRGCQTRPTGSLPAGCERYHRRVHRHRRHTQHRRIRARSDRPGRATAVHRRPLHRLPNRSAICRKLKSIFASSRCRTEKPCNGTAKAIDFGLQNPIADPADYRFTGES